jgi:hypothetical protein
VNLSILGLCFPPAARLGFTRVCARSHMEYICHSWRCVVEESANPRLQQPRPPRFVEAETSSVGARPGHV